MFLFKTHLDLGLDLGPGSVRERRRFGVGLGLQRRQILKKSIIVSSLYPFLTDVWVWVCVWLTRNICCWVCDF